jgi:iron-sulfur cluster repair protein YtfE (RIC family)
MARELRYFNLVQRRSWFRDLKKMVDPRLKVADIYRLYPETLPVLAKYKIDLCCGGRHSLEETAEKHGVDLAELIRELDEALKVRS